MSTCMYSKVEKHLIITVLNSCFIHEIAILSMNNNKLS